MSDSPAIDLEALRQLLGPVLAHHAGHLPRAMAQELLAGDFAYLAPYQLCEALLARLEPHMLNWTTAEVLRAVYPPNAFSRTRMQPIAGALGATGCQAYPAFCYYPYIPVRHMAERRTQAPLIIAVHASSRNAKDLRDQYAAFAERLGCFVLAPLFPLDLAVGAPDEEFKQLAGETLRYDQVIWAMVAEFERASGTRFDRILLFGFSGGGQFAQRLLYVDPQRIHAAAIAAPTYVTLPDAGVPWWGGLGNFEDLFGKPPQLDALRRVPVQLLCGELDAFPCHTYRPEEFGLDAAGYAAYGANRPQRLETLRQAWSALGVACESVTVPGAGHALAPLLEASKPFFERCLTDPD